MAESKPWLPSIIKLLGQEKELKTPTASVHWKETEYLFIGGIFSQTQVCIKILSQDFAGGAVVKNPSANAGDTDLIPGLGRSHMLWGN